MLKWFEKLVDPYPTKGLDEPLPTRFFHLFGKLRKAYALTYSYLFFLQQALQALKPYFFKDWTTRRLVK